MKTVNPISKKCWACNNTKFLIQFEFDQDAIDKHANICKCKCLEEKHHNHINDVVLGV